MVDRRSILVYVAGPYSAPTPEGIEANIARAREAAIALWRAGFTVICLHLNTARFEVDCPEIPHSEWLKGDFRILGDCDAMFLLPGWGLSRGARLEKEAAEKLGIPVYYSAGGLCEAYEEREEAAT